MATFDTLDGLLVHRGTGKKMAERKIGNNTWAIRGGEHTIHVKLHNTVILTIHRDGTWSFNTGGWETPTTVARLNDWCPGGWLFSLRSCDGETFLRVNTLDGLKWAVTGQAAMIGGRVAIESYDEVAPWSDAEDRLKELRRDRERRRREEQKRAHETLKARAQYGAAVMMFRLPWAGKLAKAEAVQACFDYGVQQLGMVCWFDRDVADQAKQMRRNGYELDDEYVYAYKYVSPDFTAFYDSGFVYPKRGWVEDPNFFPSPWCGHGLHASPSPRAASLYVSGTQDTRTLKMRTHLRHVVNIDNTKCKAMKWEVIG